MQQWQTYYMAEVQRLEFAGKAELLEQIKCAGESQREAWLRETERKLIQVRNGLLEAMAFECPEAVLRNPTWQATQQEFVGLFRLRAALAGQDPQQAQQQSPFFASAVA
jgi:hypothetical protein